MARNLGNMSDEIFSQLINEDKWISEIAFAVEGVSKEGKHKYWRTVTYPDEYYVTEEQIAKAKVEFARRKKEEIESIGKGDLAFVAMGMCFKPYKEDGVGCHRMRCDFTNLEGEQFFLELTLGANGFFFVDFSIDRQKQEEDNKSHGFRQTCYYAKGATRQTYVDDTWHDVIRFVNKTYGCDYKTAKLFRYFVNPDDYVCHC